MTKTNAFVIGDIHGMYHSLKVMLSHWRRDYERLIMVGDYIDRGPHSDLVLECLRELQREEDVILLRGNHEQLLLDYLKNPKKAWKLYERNGGAGTIAQLLEITDKEVSEGDSVEIAQTLRKKLPWLVNWLEDLPFYSVFGDFIIVHAGVDFNKKDWRHTSFHNFLWIREPFHKGHNSTQKSIIFGHTPVQTLHDSDEPWFHENKWGIDGGNVFGGSLIGLHINRQDILDSVILR